MQDGSEADARPEMPRVGGDRDQGVGRGTEQQVVDHSLVLQRDVGNRRRQREHHMVVGHGQEVGLVRRQPRACRRPLALRAVPVAAGVVADGRVVAVRAARDMAAERRRAAGADRRHDLELAEAEMSAMARDEAVAMPVQDIRDLERRLHHHGGAAPLWRWWGRQQGERALHLADRLQRHARVEGGALELSVPE